MESRYFQISLYGSLNLLFGIETGLAYQAISRRSLICYHHPCLYRCQHQLLACVDWGYPYAMFSHPRGSLLALHLPPKS